MRNALFMWLQKAMPGRFKAMHYYNAGAIFDALMVIFKPMMSKKMQDRVKLIIEVSIVRYTCSSHLNQLICLRGATPETEDFSL